MENKLAITPKTFGEGKEKYKLTASNAKEGRKISEQE